MTNLINKTYKIRKDQDPVIKRLSKKLSTRKVKVSQSQVVRSSIDTFAKLHETGTK